MNNTRRAQIIQTAARFFREKGYSDVTMRDLAKAMDIKAASLYNHINSKDEILSAVIMGLVEEFTLHIQATSKEESTSIEKLKDIIAMHVDVTKKRTDSLACMNKEWRYLNERDKKRFQKLRGAYEDEFVQIVKRGMANEELELDDPYIFSNSILSMLRTLYHWHDQKSENTAPNLITNLQKNMLGGIIKK